jgi:predicted transcriptional regulator of viral defense system
MAQSTESIAARLARRHAVLRTRDFGAHGVSRVALGRLVEKGVLQRLGRGLYTHADVQATEHQTLAEAARRVPAGLVCLLSALHFHELTTQVPHQVWLAIGIKSRKPSADWPPLRIVRFSERALSYGVLKHKTQGTTVRITTPAKTVADCFKYRNKIGLDVAIEALVAYRRDRRGSLDELLRAAEVDRVAVVMRPYVEATA